MSNLAEHPQALHLSKKIRDTGEGCVAARIFMPGLVLQGAIKEVENEPGLFEILAPVQSAPNEPPTPEVFTFTADQIISINWPQLPEEKSSIIQ